MTRTMKETVRMLCWKMALGSIRRTCGLDSTSLNRPRKSTVT